MTRPSLTVLLPSAVRHPLRALPSPWEETTVTVSFLEHLVVGDFRMAAQLSPTCTAAASLTLVFGWTDAQNYYLAHLQPSLDQPGQCELQLSVVHFGHRHLLAEATSESGGRAIRLERSLRSGAILIFLDGAALPVLQACDHTHEAGRIGLAAAEGTWSKDALELRGILVTSTVLSNAS